jgi:hypothetical protein
MIPLVENPKIRCITYAKSGASTIHANATVAMTVYR